jgi:DNA modification methylase
MSPYFADDSVTLWLGDSLDVLRSLPAGSVDCCVTSPPYYGLRDYGEAGQYGLEPSPGAYVETMTAVFAEVRRVLANDGTLWLNLGDSYNTSGTRQGHAGSSDVREKGHAKWYGGNRTGLPDKNLLGMPWRTAFALQADGWTLRNAIIWHKPTAMPESVTDRLSCRYEHVFLFSKSRRYWFNLDAIREPLAFPEAADGSRVFGGVNKAEALTTGSSARRTGNTYGRPQRARAEQIAAEKGLTQAHLDAIRAVGITDTGKATQTQTGVGKNRPEMQALADEAKAVLGGYYREFLTPSGKNPGDVWSIAMQPFAEAHFAVMPAALAERCVLSGCKPGGVVLDPFCGSGTTGLAAGKHGRRFVGIDLNRQYLDLALQTRLAQSAIVDIEGVA